MGIENLKTPWVPNFKGIPAKMTDSAVEAKEAIHRKIWHRSLNYVVNDICKSVVPVWKRVNRIANSIKRDRSKSKGWPQSGIDRGCLVEAPVGSHSLLREQYLSTVFPRNSTERVDPLLPFVLGTYPKVSSPFGRVTKVPRQELSGDDRGTNPLAVAGRLFCFTIRPGRLSLTSVAYEFTSIPGRPLPEFAQVCPHPPPPNRLDEESILANKYNPYTHLGAPLPAYPYKTRVGGSRSYEVPTTRSTLPKGKRCVCQVRFFLVGLGGFDKKCYAYTQDYPSSRKLRGDYFTTTDDRP
ncbi:unnamed protein product [Brassica oleracea var. botrytis]